MTKFDSVANNVWVLGNRQQQGNEKQADIHLTSIVSTV